MPSRTILFAFWGRQKNVELQLPFIQRIIKENPNVEFHGWDLCRDHQDSRYLRKLPTGDRFLIRTEFYQGDGKAMHGQNRVWKHYTGTEYRDCVFVKIDDDDLFLETNHFAQFVKSAVDHPEHVVSALTINNGACTRHIPAIWDIFEQLEPTLPEDATPHPELARLLAVHRSAEYAELSHRWFHQNWQTLIGQPTNLIPSKDWLSINCLAYTWDVGRKISALIGSRHPREVAGRSFSRTARVGDEGAANTLPKLINTGFVAGHLNFGPQERAMDPALLTELRKLYADISRQYLKQ
jgi:hypothetical protein